MRTTMDTESGARYSFSARWEGRQDAHHFRVGFKLLRADSGFKLRRW